ncbi:MAG: alanine racemase [Hyphomicrobiales bacterium]|nr:alanine racemase [Hyphomicrobiales bacterium]
MITAPPSTSGPKAGDAQAVLTIDLAALAENWRQLAMRVAPATCAAVVKADAYGIGIEAAVPALVAAGCKVFFVAHVSEARRVRALDSKVDIYVLNGLLPTAVEPCLALNLRPVLGSLSEARLWVAAAGAAPCALHVDTGMKRLGAGLAEIPDLAALRLNADLLMTHFVASENPGDPLNRQQIERFAEIRALLPPMRASLANSSALFLPEQPFGDLVRPGYALYGGNPTPGLDNPMRAVLRLDAPILQTRVIEAGEKVGYNAQWTANRRTRLATIGIGYADGLPRQAMSTDAKPGGEAIVAGHRVPFAGRVSMDLTVLDITDVPETDVRAGTRACLLGPEISIDDLGARAGTIGYEVLTRLGQRYHRVYVTE